jgi:hypothetical protein
VQFRSHDSGLDRFAEIGDLAISVRRLIARIMPPLTAILALVTLVLWFKQHPGTLCFGLISVGTLVVLQLWRAHGVGLPIVPMLALQTLLAYGLPIVVSNDSVMGYPEAYMTESGMEVLVFCCAMAAAWRFGLQVFTQSSPVCYALQGFEDKNLSRLSRLGFGLSVGATLFVLLRSAGVLEFLFELLPAGTNSIVTVVLAGASACGFFLGAMMMGKGSLSRLQRVIFWAMFALNCYVSASGFLLSTTTTVVFSVLIGLFWGTGRVPWRFLTLVIGLLAFFNAGKTEMRERYWQQTEDDSTPQIAFTETPSVYRQWTVASFEALSGAEDTSDRASPQPFTPAGATPKSGQSLFDRINNLQNILFVIASIDRDQRPPLDGATYALIPPLLMPRILWPDKPRTHEGQVLLNVHFGRQDLNSTFRTYVAWGLQAEAYGNFGPLKGNILLGLVIGLLFAGVERYISRKLLLSMEGFLGFTLFLGMANSYEMVASVLVTSIFQSFFPVLIASRPFVERIVPQPPEPAA